MWADSMYVAYVPTQSYNQYSTQQQMMNSMISLLVLAMVVGMAASMFYPHQSPEDELANLNERIRRASFARDTYKKRVQGLRERRNTLMKQYGLSVYPPLTEMKTKYHSLYRTEQSLTDAEKELDGVELRIILLGKRRKELETALGRRHED